MLYITEDRDGARTINLTRGDDAVIEVPLNSYGTWLCNVRW